MIVAPKAQELIATIDKSRSSQLRISISTWRGQRKVEIRECTAAIPNLFFPIANGITISVDQLPQLIRALHQAKEAAG